MTEWLLIIIMAPVIIFSIIHLLRKGIKHSLIKFLKGDKSKMVIYVKGAGQFLGTIISIIGVIALFIAIFDSNSPRLGGGIFWGRFDVVMIISGFVILGILEKTNLKNMKKVCILSIIFGITFLMAGGYILYFAGNAIMENPVQEFKGQLKNPGQYKVVTENWRTGSKKENKATRQNVAVLKGGQILLLILVYFILILLIGLFSFAFIYRGIIYLRH